MQYVFQPKALRKIWVFYRNVARKYRHVFDAGKWYYAYTIDNDTITIEDACHEQNMH